MLTWNTELRVGLNTIGFIFWIFTEWYNIMVCMYFKILNMILSEFDFLEWFKSGLSSVSHLSGFIVNCKV